MGSLLITEVHSYNPMISLITDSFSICLCFNEKKKISMIEVSSSVKFP